jgi:two-component system copper resistance phosphate regulon response regulator CusR
VYNIIVKDWKDNLKLSLVVYAVAAANAVRRTEIKMKILVVEDEPALNKIIAKRLKVENYAVDSALDGEEALEYLAVTEYDGAIVDIMMPRLDGLSLVKRLRAKNNLLPVLFLTARDTLQDKVSGLDCGGDDYLVKPFEFEELLARLRALLRRGHAAGSNELKLADLVLDTKAHRASRNGRELNLTAREFEMLEYLLQNAGSVLSRQQIQDHVWDFSYDGASNMIDVYINSLRKKLDKEASQPLIHTIRGVGYVLKQDQPLE